MPTGHPLLAADLPSLRCPSDRHRSPTPAARGLGIPRDQTQRHRLPTTSPDLTLWHGHLWRLARRCPDWTSWTTPDRFQWPSNVLLPPVQAAGSSLFEYDCVCPANRVLGGRGLNAAIEREGEAPGAVGSGPDGTGGSGALSGGMRCTCSFGRVRSSGGIAAKAIGGIGLRSCLSGGSACELEPTRWPPPCD
jgi:hypothetical protein